MTLADPTGTRPSQHRPRESAPAVRVLHVVGRLDRGGIETASLDICRTVPPEQAHQTFVTLDDSEGSLAPAYRAAGAAVLRCPVRPLALLPLRIWRCLRATRPDVVVSHISLFSAVVLAAARVNRVPVRIARIWSEGDSKPASLRRRLLRGLCRAVLAHAATDVLGVTAAALDFAGPRPNDRRYRVLYNGVDTARTDGWDRADARRRWNLPDDVPVLGYLGRADPVKNRPFLVEVHRAARARRPGTRLLVAGPLGTGDLTTAHPGVDRDPHVVLAGEVEEIGSVLHAADVLLLPSIREGLPGVVLEALAVGVPVVANDLRCLRELSTLVTGLTLVPLSAGPQVWARAALEQAGMADAQRAELARVLRDSPLTLHHVARQWCRLWRVDRVPVS
ncbi:glycosyl transferase [Micromonospora sp. ATCC 39149]|uniref:Glycosyltransferase family 4 protein n=1 Tax=Micromonospora carbonacea TaxID=47853 RepID=A0A7D5YIG4_9ACTN|nr:glycosyltransferase family 4 protein [Micromonospora sp. ATCC 39149]EEP74387.1 glycosyl transferase [Micromonospora sp. ATCC 39149]QLK00217.1 glycosyltransferase family 4 protein [Micromonospora carbonacea]